jgi:hypothetical protein
VVAIQYCCNTPTRDEMFVAISAPQVVHTGAAQKGSA